MIWVGYSKWKVQVQWYCFVEINNENISWNTDSFMWMYCAHTLALLYILHEKLKFRPNIIFCHPVFMHFLMDCFCIVIYLVHRAHVLVWPLESCVLTSGTGMPRFFDQQTWNRPRRGQQLCTTCRCWRIIWLYTYCQANHSLVSGITSRDRRKCGFARILRRQRNWS